jgi:hypothetical protein
MRLSVWVMPLLILVGRHRRAVYLVQLPYTYMYIAADAYGVSEGVGMSGTSVSTVWWEGWPSMPPRTPRWSARTPALSHALPFTPPPAALIVMGASSDDLQHTDMRYVVQGWPGIVDSSLTLTQLLHTRVDRIGGLVHRA